MDDQALNSSSPFSTNDMATTAIARADDSALVVRQTSSSFNSHIKANTSCSRVRAVDHLPTEILQAIFIHCARDYFSEHSSHAIPVVPAWVNISFVNVLWRGAALNCPILWSYLFIASSRWTEESLTRSKQAPLKLYVKMNHAVDMLRLNTDHSNHNLLVLRFVEQVMAHNTERIEELHLFIDHGVGHLREQILRNLSSRAPRLQHLEIVYLDGEQFQMPFNGDTPSLRTLALAGPRPWDSLQLSHLTTFELTHIPPSSLRNALDFITTLGRLQNLENLCLSYPFAISDDFLSSTAFHTFQKVDLPSLSHLFLAGVPSSLITFLACVHIPLKTEVRLALEDFYGGEGLPSRDYTLGSLLAQRYVIPEGRALSSPVIRSLIMCSIKKDTKVTFCTTEHDPSSVATNWNLLDWSRNIPLQVFLPTDELLQIPDGECSMGDIFGAMSLSNVQTLHAFDPLYDSPFWEHVLGYLSNVRYIKLRCGDMPQLASLLALAPSDLSEGTGREHNIPRHGQIFAPALEELELCEIQFLEDWEEEVASLCDALSTRKEPRGRLTMTRCTGYGSNNKKKVFDMTWWWGGGHFHVVDQKNYDPDGR